MFSEQSSPLAKRLGEKKKLKKFKSDSYKAAEGRRRKQSFPADIHTELSAAKYPPGNI